MILILALLASIPLLGAAGLAVDAGAIVHEKSVLQSGCADPASLAGARLAGDTTAMRDEANRVLALNSCPPATFTFTSTALPNDTLKVTITRSRPTAFIRVLGIANVSVTGRSTAQGWTVRTCIAPDGTEIPPGGGLESNCRLNRPGWHWENIRHSRRIK